MPAVIPELDEIGPRLEADGLFSLRTEVAQLLQRRTLAFPGSEHASSHVTS